MSSYSRFKNTILLTGGSGRLGKKLKCYLKGFLILTPSHSEFDISNYKSIEGFFLKQNLDNLIILNCAALVGETEARENPEKLYMTNVMGVQNVKRACIKYNCFLLQISTEYVFDGDRGQYSEKDLPNPITRYGWSKVIGEEVLYDMKQSLILRLSFVDPDDLKFPKALIDQYSSRDLIENTCADIKLLLMAINRGIIIPRLLHIGAERRSQYDFYKTFKSAIEKKSLKEIPFRLPVDVSFDLSLWKKIKAEILNKCNKSSLKEDGQ